MTKLSGGCLCGAVRYSAEGPPLRMAVCHCTDCQKHSGSAFAVIAAVTADALQVEGSTRVFETTGESGAKVARHFCGECGSTLMSVPGGAPHMRFLNAGGLDDTSWLEPEAEIYRDHAQPWVTKSAERPTYPRARPR